VSTEDDVLVAVSRQLSAPKCFQSRIVKMKSNGILLRLTVQSVNLRLQDRSQILEVVFDL
jgi:hypothetical protein